MKPRTPGLWMGIGDEKKYIEASEKFLLEWLDDPYNREAYERLRRRGEPKLQGLSGLLPSKKGAFAEKYQWPSNDPVAPRRTGAPKKRLTSELEIILADLEKITGGFTKGNVRKFVQARLGGSEKITSWLYQKLSDLRRRKKLKSDNIP